MSIQDLKVEYESLYIFLDRLKNKEETEAIFLLGGLGKQKNIHPIDRFSDYDIAVFLSGSTPPRWLPQFSFNLYLDNFSMGKQLNVYQCMTNDLFSHQTVWSHSKCEAYTHAEIYYERGNRVTKRIKEIIEKSDNRLKMLANNLHKISRFTHRNPQKMIYRGHLLSGFLMLNKSIKYIFESIFLANNCFVPHMKWQENDIHSLEWIPKSFWEDINNAIVTYEISETELLRKAEIIDRIYSEILSYCQNSLPTDFYNYICCNVNKDRQLLNEPLCDKLLKEFPEFKDCDTEELVKSYINCNLLSETNSSEIEFIKNNLHK